MANGYDRKLVTSEGKGVNGAWSGRVWGREVSKRAGTGDGSASLTLERAHPGIVGLNQLAREPLDRVEAHPVFQVDRRGVRMEHSQGNGGTSRLLAATHYSRRLPAFRAGAVSAPLTCSFSHMCTRREPSPAPLSALHAPLPNASVNSLS